MLVSDHYPLLQEPQAVEAQLPHADEEAELLAGSDGFEEFDLNEHADISFLILLLLHSGQSGVSPPNTRASNCLLQSSQVYSYIGIYFFSIIIVCNAYILIIISFFARLYFKLLCITEII